MGGFAQAGVQIGAGAAQGASVGGPIGAGIGAAKAAIQVAISDLIQHSARLKAAKSENAGIPPVVAAFDADVAAIVSAYNNGQATASDCIKACQYVDANIKANLQANVGAPGTAWSDSVGMSGKCNKQCTAGCCVYFGDLGPVLSLMQVAMGGPGGAWGRGDPRLTLTTTGGTIKVPEVFASKYGGQDRPSYEITISRAPGIGAVQAGILSTVDELLGNSPSALQGLLPSGVSGGSVNPVLLIVGVAFVFVAVLIAVIAGRS
jgi:hypothetical protein